VSGTEHGKQTVLTVTANFPKSDHEQRAYTPFNHLQMFTIHTFHHFRNRHACHVDIFDRGLRGDSNGGQHCGCPARFHGSRPIEYQLMTAPCLNETDRLRQTDRHRPTDSRQTNRPTDSRQTDKQTDRHQQHVNRIPTKGVCPFGKAQSSAISRCTKSQLTAFMLTARRQEWIHDSAAHCVLINSQGDWKDSCAIKSTHHNTSR
jgi:hypothetical protein